MEQQSLKGHLTERDAGAVPASAAARKVGDVFQIIETHGRQGWIGAFVMATEIKTWGIQGFVPYIKTHDEQTRIYIRLKWDEIEYIGHAPLMPADEVPMEERRSEKEPAK